MANQRNIVQKVGRLKLNNFQHLDKEFDHMKARFDNDVKTCRPGCDFGSFFGLNKPVQVDTKYGHGKKGFDAEINEIEKIVKSRTSLIIKSPKTKAFDQTDSGKNNIYKQYEEKTGKPSLMKSERLWKSDHLDELKPKRLSELKYYEKLRLLGAGGFGKVYLVKHKKTGMKCAAKEQDRCRMSKREARILNKLQHPDAKHIIQLIGYHEGEAISVTLTEFLMGGELFRCISSPKYHLTELKCQLFAKQILLAIEFMHDNGIIHLDLKPENILLVNNLIDDPVNNYRTSSNESLKIIDFGLAKNMGTKDKISIRMCGTLEFISPEVMRSSHASYASDMWSVGVIIYLMISGGLSPFWAGNEYETKRNVIRAKFAKGGYKHRSFSNVSTNSLDYISKLLTLDPEYRLTAKESLQHEWLQMSGTEDTVDGINKLKKLDTAQLRKFLARRRWKRWFNTIKAINRIVRMSEV